MIDNPTARRAKLSFTILILRYALIVALLAGCTDTRQSTQKLFINLVPETTGIAFVNQLSDTGKLNILDYLYYYNGAGVATGDVNNDGYVDVYFVSNVGLNRLYINNGIKGKGISFRDVTVESGVGGNAAWQTGVTMADVNADGWLDIYVCAVSNFKGLKGHNELYINNGPGKNGEVTFREAAAEYGLDFSGFSTQAVFFDYDKDSDLDMFLLNHAVHTSRSYGMASTRGIPDAGAGDYLYENQLVTKTQIAPVAEFVDVTRRAGIYQAAMGYGLGVSVADFNNDGWEDIYVGNDFHEDDYFYVNNHDGTFTERLKERFEHVSRFSMGNDAADINNDGYIDLMTLDMYPSDETVEKSSAGEDPFDIFLFKLKYGYYYQYSRNCLQLNIEGKGFSDVAMMSGVGATDWSWSTLLADYDNDGMKDIFITNGIVHRPNDLDYVKFISNNSQQWTPENTRTLDQEAIALMPEGKVHNYMFRGTDSLFFKDASIDWGFETANISSGAAYADLDNDGDLDVVINNINENAGIYENTSDTKPGNTYIKIRLKGKRGNTSGIGAKVFIRHNGSIQFQQLMPTRGFMSSSDLNLNFGVREAGPIDTLMVIWPDMTTEIRTNLAVNTTVTLNQGDANHRITDYRETIFGTTTPLFQDVTKDHRIDYTHHENTFYDFYSEPLVPFQVSREGPKLAVADVNMDGLDDMFACGARGQAGELYVQMENGDFRQSSNNVFSADSLSEDVDAAFFDADGDKDQDLYVVSGGNEFGGNNTALLDRLFINDGHGNFHKSTDSLPLVYSNKSCVVPCDFDRDGDIDLFVGGRVVNHEYGVTPDSHLLVNDGNGKFSDQVSVLAPSLQKAGMVTDASWVDWDKDGDEDLVVVGDWMSVKVFTNEKGQLNERLEMPGLSKRNGFWQAVTPGDFDNDGDQDLLLGNLGTNSKFNKSPQAELRLYIKDIDGNGSLDHIVAYKIGNAWYPIAAMDELSKQIPLLRKRFINYKEYAGKSLDEIFKGDELENALILHVNAWSSLYMENKGGQWKEHVLPAEAQMTKIFSFFPFDFDNDGNLDIALGGNFYGANTYQGRYDAGYGLVLRNLGGGTFDALNSDVSGIFLRGEVRDIKNLTTSRGNVIVVARNGMPLQFYQSNGGKAH